MARLYDYGRLNQIVNIPAKNALPGTFVVAQGANMAQSAINVDSTYDIEFGEPVEIVSENAKSVTVKRATSSITAAKTAFVVRDIQGLTIVQKGTLEIPKKGLPATVIKSDASAGWDIVVPLAASQTVTVGNPVFIGKGSGSTVVGAVYTTAQGAGGVDTVEVTGWKFKSAKFKPTSSAGECVWIGK